MTGAGTLSVSNNMVTHAEAVELIKQGDYLIIAGDEAVLQNLPTGNWIAGTIPYFMTEQGGQLDQQHLYVTQISGIAPNARPYLTMYDTSSISRVASEAPEHGFTILLLPSGSDVHTEYAQHAPDYQDMFFSPIVGWIAGARLDDTNAPTPKVGFGPGGNFNESQAVAMHIPLHESQVAQVHIINLFGQGNGPVITFEEHGAEVTECLVDGEKWRFSDYVKESKIDTRLPLVADYSGVLVNVSIQEIKDDSTQLYAPVFPGIKYKFAEPVGDYVELFNTAIKDIDQNGVSFSCNCILNYLYGELEGRKTGFMGPMTFGEVAYQLLNQTLVYLKIENI